MVLSKEDRIIIEACYKEKGWTAGRVLREFPGKNWKRRAIERLIKNIRETGNALRKSGSGRPKTASIQENIDYINENICSQEEKPGSHLSQRKIAQNLDISQTTVHRIIKKNKKLDLLKEYNVLEMMIV